MRRESGEGTEAAIRLTVVPEPDDEEAEALAVAMAALSSRSRPAAGAAEQAPSRWAMAGRRAAMRGVGPSPVTDGWRGVGGRGE